MLILVQIFAFEKQSPADSAIEVEVIQGNQVILQFPSCFIVNIESGVDYEGGGLFLLLSDFMHSTLPQHKMLD